MNSSKTYKIAVCLSGQARHWRIAAENIKQYFDFSERYSPTITTDYFIHTWDTNTWRYPKRDHWFFDEDKHQDEEEIKSTFAPKYFVQEKWISENFTRAWDPMFYSFAESLILKRNYEIENHFEYDLVIKARLDVIYTPNLKFPLMTVNPGVCYSSKPISKFPTEFNGNNFDDVIYYGDSRTMDLVGSLFDTYRVLHNPTHLANQQQSENLDPTIYYGPGCLIYDHCMKLNIATDGSRIFDYVVVRSTAAERGLHSIKDFEEIRRLGIEWYIN